MFVERSCAALQCISYDRNSGLKDFISKRVDTLPNLNFSEKPTEDLIVPCVSAVWMVFKGGAGLCKTLGIDLGVRKTNVNHNPSGMLTLAI